MMVSYLTKLCCDALIGTGVCIGIVALTVAPPMLIAAAIGLEMMRRASRCSGRSAGW